MKLNAKARLRLTAKKGVSIGTYVILEKLISGYPYGRVTGFKMAPGAKMQNIPGLGLAPVGKVESILVDLLDANGKESRKNVAVPSGHYTPIEEYELRQRIQILKNKKQYTGTPVSTPGALEIVYKDENGKPRFMLRTDLKNTEVIPARGELQDVYDVYGQQFRDYYTPQQAHERFQSIFRVPDYETAMKRVSKSTRLPGKFYKKRGTGVTK